MTKSDKTNDMNEIYQPVHFKSAKTLEILKVVHNMPMNEKVVIFSSFV